MTDFYVLNWFSFNRSLKTDEYIKKRTTTREHDSCFNVKEEEKKERALHDSIIALFSSRVYTSCVCLTKKFILCRNIDRLTINISFGHSARKCINNNNNNGMIRNIDYLQKAYGDWSEHFFLSFNKKSLYLTCTLSWSHKQRRSRVSQRPLVVCVGL